MSETKGVRINKYLADAGICSRRGADELIESGRVSINGETAILGMFVPLGAEVMVDGRKIVPADDKVYLALYKPRGIVCTEEKREKNNIVDFLKYPKRVTYCGRLDKDSEGLILMTNDGDIINKIMRARNRHEKEYYVTVDNKITRDFVEKMQAGLFLSDLGETTRECEVEQLSEKSFRIILTQGLNRQIRRMCAALGYQVLSLKRVRIMNIELGKLKPGEYRELTKDEILCLSALTRDDC